MDRFIAAVETETVPVDVALGQIEGDAFARFGKGRHPAALNYGDTFAYALARAGSEALLYKGEDFRRTDITAAA